MALNYDPRNCGLVEHPLPEFRAGKWRCHGCERESSGYFIRSTISGEEWKYKHPLGWNYLEAAAQGWVYGKRIYCAKCWEEINEFASNLRASHGLPLHK